MFGSLQSAVSFATSAVVLASTPAASLLELSRTVKLARVVLEGHVSHVSRAWPKRFKMSINLGNQIVGLILINLKGSHLLRDTMINSNVA